MSAPDFRLKLYLVKSSGNPLHSRHRVLAKGNTRVVAAHEYGFHFCGAAEDAQERDGEERFSRRRKWSEAVAHLRTKRLDILGVGHVSEPAVHVELGVLRRDVLVRQIRRNID